MSSLSDVRKVILCSKTLWRETLYVKPMVFPGVMYVCERWTMKKTEHQRIDDFKL